MFYRVIILITLSCSKVSVAKMKLRQWLITVCLSLAQRAQSYPKNILFLAADDLRPNLGSYDDSNSGYLTD